MLREKEIKPVTEIIPTHKNSKVYKSLAYTSCVYSLLHECYTFKSYKN